MARTSDTGRSPRAAKGSEEETGSEVAPLAREVGATTGAAGKASPAKEAVARKGAGAKASPAKAAAKDATSRAATSRAAKAPAARSAEEPAVPESPGRPPRKVEEEPAGKGGAHGGQAHASHAHAAHEKAPDAGATGQRGSHTGAGAVAPEKAAHGKAAPHRRRAPEAGQAADPAASAVAQAEEVVEEVSGEAAATGTPARERSVDEADAAGDAGPAPGAPAGGTAAPAAPTPAAAAESYAGDLAFLAQQREALLAERATYAEQARVLRAEAESLVAEAEPGDVQFDEESGEGGTTTVDRERDLALSAQALAAVEEIDRALEKIDQGTYGVCENCGQLITQPRLEALPYARLCISCKNGGLSRR